jgi:hypothetical protein
MGAEDLTLDDYIRRIRNQVASLSGSSAAQDRCALAATVERKTVRDPAVAPLAHPALESLSSAVVDHPVATDLEALRSAGFSDDAIFELVLTASTAVGHAQFEEAVRAFNEARK